MYNASKYLKFLPQDSAPKCLHDSVINKVEYNDEKICFYLNDGFFLTNNYTEQTTKNAIVVANLKVPDAVVCEKKRDHTIFHKYFGVTVLSDLSELERKLKKGYNITFIEEYYNYGYLYWELSIEKINKKSEYFYIKICPLDSIEYHWDEL